MWILHNLMIVYIEWISYRIDNMLFAIYILSKWRIWFFIRYSCRVICHMPYSVWVQTKCGLLTLVHRFKCKQRVVHYSSYILDWNNTRKHKELWFLADIKKCAHVGVCKCVRGHACYQPFESHIFLRVPWIWNLILGGFWNRWSESELRIQITEMADPIWRTKIWKATRLGLYLVLRGFWGRWLRIPA